MKESENESKRREEAFFLWLSSQVTSNQLSDFYLVLETVNKFGKMKSWFQESLFELRDLEHSLKFQRMIQNDKRFQFVHYKEIKIILVLLQKYCEYIEENERLKTQSTKSADESKSLLIEEKNKPVKLKTKNGSIYYGETPAEVFASLCEQLDRFYPETFNSLIGVPYSNHGSIVLFQSEPKQGGIRINDSDCFIDKTLGKDAVIPYGKWLCKMCGDSNWPETIIIQEIVVHSKEMQQKKNDGMVGTQQIEADEKIESQNTSASRKWSDLEIALLIEAYLKATENGSFQAAAEKLSGMLRDWAVKNGKEIDSTYRNVNGITMQLSTVQYCFTNGKKGLSNASSQIREMVEMFKFHPNDYMKVLEEAHHVFGEKNNEISTNLDNKKHMYCLKTNTGNCYYGITPSKTLALFCEKLAQKYPIKMRDLIGRKYRNVGQIVLFSYLLENDGIQLTTLNAYIDKGLGMAQTEFYARLNIPGSESSLSAVQSNLSAQ